MSKNAKVKGENVKELTFDVKSLNLDERCEFNNIVTRQAIDKMVWGDYVKMVRIASNLTDDDINDLTDTEVITVAWKCYEVVNKKKLKK
tara:strand:+ start:4090 stop:4356 length:267 start_codon:yes stop_codon:yes gene_type:complete